MCKIYVGNFFFLDEPWFIKTFLPKIIHFIAQFLFYFVSCTRGSTKLLVIVSFIFKGRKVQVQVLLQFLPYRYDDKM